jgi:DNA-repair protein complementing XP-A cells
MSYCDYNLSNLIDTKGGFLADPLTEAKVQISWDPEIDLVNQTRCRHCSSLEIDQNYLKYFDVNICKTCIKSDPKHSLLTKTEVKSDYLLTESELRDSSRLPHWEKPNPHSKTYSNMMLYLRSQVEDFAISKWGSLEELDREFDKRESAKKASKIRAFKKKNKELRSKTMLQRDYSKKDHVHKWSESVPSAKKGWMEQICSGCGLLKEFEEF